MRFIRIACSVLLSGFLVGVISSTPVSSAFAEEATVAVSKPPRKSPGKSKSKSVAPPKKKDNGSAKQRDAKRRADETRQRQEAQRRADTARKRQEAQRRADEARKRQDAQRRADDLRKRQEAQRRADELRNRQEAQRRGGEARKSLDAQRRADEARRQAADRKSREDAQRREIARQKNISQQRSMEDARKREAFQKRTANDIFQDRRKDDDSLNKSRDNSRDKSRNDFFNRKREEDKRNDDFKRRFGNGNDRSFSNDSTIIRDRKLQDEIDKARLLKRSRDFLSRNRITPVNPPRPDTGSIKNRTPDLKSYNRENRSFSDFNKKSDSDRVFRDFKVPQPKRSSGDSFTKKKPDISYDPTPFNNSKKARTGDVPRSGSFSDYAKGKTSKTKSDSFTDYAMRNRDDGNRGRDRDDIVNPEHRGRDKANNTRKHRSWHRRLNHNQNVRDRLRRYLDYNDHHNNHFYFGLGFSSYNDYFYGGYNYRHNYGYGYRGYNGLYCGFPSSWWVNFNWHGGHYRGSNFGFRFGHYYGHHNYTYWPQRHHFRHGRYGRVQAWWYNDYCDWYYGSWYRPYVKVVYVNNYYDYGNNDSYDYNDIEYVDNNYDYDNNEYADNNYKSPGISPGDSPNDSYGWLPTDVEAAPTLDDAWQLLSEGYLDEARDAFVEVGELFPFEGEPQIGYSIATGLLSDHEASVYAMRKALNDEPESLLDVPQSSSMDILLNRLLEMHYEVSREGNTNADTLFMISSIRYLLNEEALAYFTIDEAIDMGDQSDSTLNLKAMVRAAMYEDLFE